ncbi:hypothetical protein ES705_43572 [subsurface metagenome]|jgi:hypothetical protein
MFICDKCKKQVQMVNVKYVCGYPLCTDCLVKLCEIITKWLEYD